MKRLLTLGILLSAVVLFAGCTNPSDNGDESARSELQAAFGNQSQDYSASYLLTVSSPTQEYSQEMKYFIMGKDRVRIDSRMDSSGGKQESRAYMLGNKSSLCYLNASVWSCASSELGAGSPNSYEVSRQKMDAAISSATVQRLAERVVAGLSAKCYNLSGSSYGVAWDYLYCVSEGGVPLYVVAESGGIVITQEATAYSNNVSSLDYILPVQDNAIDQNNASDLITPAEPVTKRTFQETNDSLCLENGKPVIRLFSTTWCPHCKWIKDTFDETVEKYVVEGKIVAHHWEFDTLDDTLTPEKEGAVPDSEKAVFDKYNPSGGVPTYVFGCKYIRVGNGYESTQDLEAEKKEFIMLIEELAS